MNPIHAPKVYDYIGVYVTNRCFLNCDYCITHMQGARFINERKPLLSTEQWIEGLNRLQLEHDIPLTLQGGEPFVFPGIWDILNHVEHKMDILTALPKNVTPERLLKLNTRQWNQRKAPYPTIRVSYHKGQNDYQNLIPRIAELQDIVSIGLYHIEHPGYPQEFEKIQEMADRYGIECRRKEFLGFFEGKMYGRLKYKDAASGKVVKNNVMCKNSVLPIGPDGNMYKCHSDLYFKRHLLAIANLGDDSVDLEPRYRACQAYGLCSECDVKEKNKSSSTIWLYFCRYSF